MSSEISSVKFHLYRKDTNEIMQNEIALSKDTEADGLYTFTGIFTATQHSSFGLDLNAFGVSVTATDAAQNTATISDGNLQDGADSNNFSMAVRVKETIAPTIEAEPGAWPTQWKDSVNAFVAKFIVGDKNEKDGSTFRLAGIDTSKLEITVNGELQVLPNEISSYFTEYVAATNSTNNDAVYRVSYQLPSKADGTYTIRIKVWDNDGNEAYFEKTQIVDVTAPSISLTSPTAAPNNVGNFSVIGTVDGPATVTIIISKDDEIITTDEVIVSALVGGEFSKDYTNQVDGLYKVEVYATDEAGNKSPTTTVEFIIDTQLPIFTSVKFYAILEGGVADTTPATEFVAGTQYKIVVQVE